MDETLNHKLIDFYWHRKPMGFIGYASILAARVFQEVRITLGDRDELLRHAIFGGARRRRRVMREDRYIYAVERMGATLVNQNIFQVLHDTNYLIYSTPGRLSQLPGRSYHNVSQGIGYLVDQMVQSLGDDE
ncbi:hypothetical protein TKK_0010640 [Trichogramma kaykai]|uniref:Uncharacterized protein n=1 Tax=Trichogramma kaykai TaxID=54128 RepID=A0ABD2WW25_9HYME